MIIYKRKKKQLIIPCGLGPVVCEDSNYELEMKQVDSSTVLQQVEPDEGYYGLYRVIVNPYTVEWKNRPITGNGTFVIMPENADALSGVEISVDVQPNLQEKSVDSSTVSQVVSADNDYDGLSRVNVNPYTLESKSQVITVNGEYTVTPSGADGLSSVDISVNVADIPAVLQEKTVDSSTENQAITPDEGYDGLSQVNVNPYTLESKSDTITDNGMYTYYPNTADGLDQVIIDVSVDTVNNQSKTVDSSTEMQYVQPDQGYTGLDYVAVNPYTLDSKTVDSSTISQIIVSDEDGLSSVTVNPYTLESKSDTLTVNGQYVYTADNADALSQVLIDVSINTVNNQSKTADSSTVSQAITPDHGYTGLESVTINPYTLDSKTVDSSTVSQTIVSDEDGLSSVTVNPYTLESKSDTLTANGQYTYTADNADALSEVTIDVSINTVNNQSKTVDSSTVSQAITPDQGYTGLDSVTVNPYVLDNKTVNPSTNVQVVTSDEDGLASVTVNAIIPSTLTADSSTNPQEFRPIFPNQWFNDVIVNPYTVESDSSVLTHNGQYVFMPENADALSQVIVDVSINTVNNQAKTADSSTVSQNITPDQGYTGLDSVTINPYVLDSKTVNSSTSQQVITSDEDGLSSVTVNPYVLDSKTVDSSTVSQTVTSDADGLSSVTVNPYRATGVTVDPCINERTYIPGLYNYDAWSQVTVNAVTAAIDPDILAENIKKDVEILGVTGTFEGGTLGTKTVDASTVQQTVTPDASDYGLSLVTVNPYTVESDSSTLTANGQYTFTPQNADALSQVTVDVSINTVNNQTKTVDSSTVSQSVTPDQGYTGLDSVTVNPYTLESDSSVITQNGQYVFTPTNADGLSQVTVDVSANIANIQDDASASINGYWFAGPEFTIVPLEGYDAMSTVKVRADLGTVTIQPSSTYEPGAYISSYPQWYGFHSVIVKQVTAAIDPNIQASNIKDGVTILGVTGSYTGDSSSADTVYLNAFAIEKIQNSNTYIETNYLPDASLNHITGFVKGSLVQGQGQWCIIYSIQHDFDAAIHNDLLTFEFGSGSARYIVSFTNDEVDFKHGIMFDASLNNSIWTVTANGVTKTCYDYLPNVLGSIYNLQLLRGNMSALSFITFENGTDSWTFSPIAVADVSNNVINSYYDLALREVHSVGGVDTVNYIVDDSGGNSLLMYYRFVTYEANTSTGEIMDLSDASRNVVMFPIGNYPSGVKLPDYSLGSKTVDSSTISQTVTPDASDYGLSSVTVNPVTSNIDSNIQAGNIKSGVTILGVEGTYSGQGVNLQAKTVDSSTVSQDVTADNGYDALSRVTVNPYVLDTKTVDSSTVSQVITSNEDGLSSVTVNPYVLDSSTVNPSTNQFTVTSAQDGLSSVTVNAVTSSIDSNISASNIRNGVTILGVEGTYAGQIINNQNKTADSSTASQIISADTGYTGLGTVTVNPYVLDTKTVDSSTVSQVITSDEDGLSSVTVNPYVLDSKTVNASTVEQVITSDADGLSSVIVNAAPLQSRTVDASTVALDIARTMTSYYGMNHVYINPVTASIDSNIAAGNIKNGVTILGVQGTFEGGTLGTKTVDSSTSSQIVTPAQGDYGLSSVTVNPYVLDSKTVDSSTVSQVITSDEDGLSSVTVNPYTLQERTVNTSNWSYTSTRTVTPEAGYNGLSKVTISAPPADENITVDASTSSQTVTPGSGNLFIKSVTVNPYTVETASVNASTAEQVITPANADALSSVTVNAAPLQNRTVDASTVQLDIQRTSNDYYGLRHVYINAVTSSIDSNIQAGNIKSGVTILGVTGSYVGQDPDYDTIYNALIQI